jgi:hypothetical protein
MSTGSEDVLTRADSGVGALIENVTRRTGLFVDG